MQITDKRAALLIEKFLNIYKKDATPYHKWLLRVTDGASHKPEHFDERLQKVMAGHNLELVNEFGDPIISFLKIDAKALDWPNYFLADSELDWIEHAPPIDDL